MKGEGGRGEVRMKGGGEMNTKSQCNGVHNGVHNRVQVQIKDSQGRQSILLDI